MRSSIIWNSIKEHIMTKKKHEVHIVLRDWTKAKKVNRPIAEIHSDTKQKETKKNGRS